MACSDCFNGCPEITSDKCVKYTGIPIPLLGIQTGDSLSYVEQAIIGFLTSALDGSGIIPNINTGSSSGIGCPLFSSFLPDCKDFSLNDFLIALIKTACNLDERVVIIEDKFEELEDDYTTDCLDIEPNAGTHAILQAVIQLVCQLDSNIRALALELSTNYASIGIELNAQIQNYLNTIAPTTDKMYLKMLPYTAVEYYGPLTNYPTAADYFDATGAGHGVWEQIYLCNGDNSTPDKRGRVGVGVTNMFGTIPLDPAVVSPIYVLKTKNGANTITLAPSEMPVHSHTATSTPAVDPHSHFTVGSATGTDATLTPTNTLRAEHLGSGSTDYTLRGVVLTATLGLTNAVTVGMTVGTTIANSGGGLAHNNIQPSLGCYYIIYIPI